MQVTQSDSRTVPEFALQLNGRPGRSGYWLPPKPFAQDDREQIRVRDRVVLKGGLGL